MSTTGIASLAARLKESPSLRKGLGLLIVGLVLGGVLISLPGLSTPEDGARNDKATSVTDNAASNAFGNLSGTAASAAAVELASANIGPAQRKEIEGIIRSYLLNNPEIILEMQREFERRMEAAQQERMKLALSQYRDEIFYSPTTPVAGNPKGDVTVVEFFDYNCGFCRRAISAMAKLVESDKNVRFLFKEFPIFGKDSEAAARIAVAAKKQGKYWEMHRALLEAPGRANEAKGLRIAKKLGLDIEQLKRDMNSEEVKKEIRDAQALADKLGIRGTPHFLIGDQVIPGAPENLYEQLVEKIAQVRKNGCAVC